MTKTALVLGASGGFGGQVALALQGAGWQVNRYQRGTDMAAAAKGADLIVNGLNPPAYHNWEKLIPEITASVLAAGKASGATLRVPGNVYPYGKEPGPWNADTAHRPVSRKGRIRAEMEAEYRTAAGRGQRGRGERDFKHFGAHALQGQTGKVDVHAPRLRFGQNGHHFAGLHFAQGEGADKRRQPFVFDLFHQHAGLLNRRVGCTTHPTSCQTVYMNIHVNRKQINPLQSLP
mgnify:CR=1 FL=1